MGEAPSQVHLSSKWPQTPLVKAWRKIYGTYSEHCCRKLLPGAWPPLQSRGSNLSLNWWKATTSNVGSQLRLRPPVLEVDGLVFFCYVNQAILVACPSGSFLGLHWSVQFSSVAQSCPALCDPMNHSTPGLPVHHQLPEFTQTHVHRVCDAIQPSHPLSSPSPLALNLSQHQGLFQWISSSHQVATVLEFQLQFQSFQWTISYY